MVVRPLLRNERLVSEKVALSELMGSSSYPRLRLPKVKGTRVLVDAEVTIEVSPFICSMSTCGALGFE